EVRWGSAYARVAQRSRRVLVRAGFVVVDVGVLLFVLHTHDQVASGNQVIQGFHGIERYLNVVEVGAVCFGNPPQRTATVVMVDDRGLPGLFVDEEVALGGDVSLA